MDFCHYLAKERGVAAIPYRNPPENQRLIRFCIAKERQTLDAAINKLR